MSRFFSRARLTGRVVAALCAALFLLLAHPALAAGIAPADSLAPSNSTDLTGTVSDSASGAPLATVQISVTRAGTLVANTTTDEFGRFIIHNLDAGTYAVSVRYLGFRPATQQVTTDGSSGERQIQFRLVPMVMSLATVEVKSGAPLAVNTRTGDQTFRQNDYHGAPTNTTSQILQQSIAGAARAPTGEVHIRGQHAEYTYYVDGVPVPAGISGSLNELFDPDVVNTIDFQTGGWDAEYGNKNAAIINVTTKIPTGGFHSDASAYTGSFNSRGGSLDLSNNVGKLGMFISGALQSTDMRLEPVVGDSVTNVPYNFHNHGDDAFGFGKLEYRASNTDVLDLDLNWSRTRFGIPYDSSGGTFLDDHQTDVNGFANLSWRHLFGAPGSNADAGGPSELFGGVFLRAGSLDYVPGAGDDPQFIFYPDTTPYNLRENRNFSTVGVKFDYTIHPRHDLTFKTGVLGQFTNGHEDFATTDAAGNSGPVSNSGLNGNDLGVYAQTAYAPVEQFEIRTGVRYDSHQAPFAGTTSQVSPRVRFNFFLNPANTLYLYYGRLFMPTNVEDLRAITGIAQGGVAATPTLPERDNFYEAGVIHRFPFAGMVTKFSAYHKDSRPGNDDNTVPGSAITTTVNIDQVWITGLEGVLEFHPDGPLSGYVNAAVNHAYGRGPITGGFFPTDNPTGYFDLDHDQRVSIVASATYSANRFYASATWDYGSGLTNGVDPSDCGGCAYSTGLFASNSAIKVAPNAVTSASVGYTLLLNGLIVRPEVFVDNVFDKHYILKGAFFSGASYGRPRSIQMRVHVAM